MTHTELAASFDLRPLDEAKYERAITRRNNAHVHFRNASEALQLAEARGAEDLRPWVGAFNEALNELEHAQRDLVWAKGWFQENTATCRFCHRREPILRGTYTRITFADGISLVCDDCREKAD